MTRKNDIIDRMHELLEFGRNLPMFSVCFKIKANNEAIEEYLLAHVDTMDYEGRPLPSETIERDKINRIERFRNSKYYSSSGISYLLMSQTMTCSDIQFEKIRKLIYGEIGDMPKGYEFVGSFTLLNSQEIEDSK